jgi:hypothetical protein
MCVTITRVSRALPRCASGPSGAVSARQAASVSGVLVPVSTMAQPGPQVDVVQREGQRHAQPQHAGRHLGDLARRRRLAAGVDEAAQVFAGGIGAAVGGCGRDGLGSSGHGRFWNAQAAAA